MPKLVEKGELIGQGRTAEIYAWGDQKVLKLYRKGIPEDLCVNEFNVTKFVYEHMKIAPKPIEIIHSENRIGAVYERLSGRTMLKMLVSKPWRLKKYSKMLAGCHVKMQVKSDISASTVKQKLQRDIEGVSLLSSEQKQLINTYLDTLPDGDCICHFDFHPDNIMLQADQYYIIDWMTGCIGDPLADVARTELLFTYGEAVGVPFFIKAAFKVAGRRIRKIYLAEYIKLTGANLSDIEKWKLPIAAARLCEWVSDKESGKLLDYIRRELAGM